MGLLIGGQHALAQAGQDQVRKTHAAAQHDLDKIQQQVPELDAFFGPNAAIPKPDDFGFTGTASSYLAAGRRFDTQVNVFLAQASQQQALISQDQDLVNDGITRIGDTESQPGVWFQHGPLDADSSRLGYERLALNDAATLAQLASNRLKASKELVDALVAFVGVADKLNARDLRGALNACDGVSSLLYQAQSDGQDAHFDSVWDEALADFNKLVNDLRTALQGVVNGEGLANSGPDPFGLDADARALVDLNISSLAQDNYSQGLITEMKNYQNKAGINSPSGTL